MPKLIVHSFAMTLDGYSAGPDQSLENPLGVGGVEMMQWFFPTQVFQSMHGGGQGETGVDNTVAQGGFANMGAWILGRNMFGPVRGPWPDDSWRGWWGDEPPYHVPTFVLTHHARSPIEMKGGTTFHFVTDGLHAAYDAAMDAAKGKNVRLGGGVSTVRQYLQARLIDEMHLALAPILMGRGENLLAGLNLKDLGYDVVDTRAGERATHVFIRRKA
jgi:dihydrofolate reductase